tara:strand:+ start:107 stop:799 length:693 start_codon:yes stop_codon:yes gene_type:complete
MSTKDYIKRTSKMIQENVSINQVDIDIDSEIPDNVNVAKVLTTFRGSLPKGYFKKLNGIKVLNLEEFDQRNISAKYSADDRILYISAERQDSNADMLDDLLHEMGHHAETLYGDFIYGDGAIKDEFIMKRMQLRFELGSDGYDYAQFDFKDVEYNPELDDYLYKRIGKEKLKMMTAGMFIRPYQSLSIREYFAVGFEQFYLGNHKTLHRDCPVLYKRVSELDRKVKKESR